MSRWMWVVSVLLVMMAVSYLASLFVEELKLVPSVFGVGVAVALMFVSFDMTHSRWWYFASDVCLLVSWVLIGVMNATEWMPYWVPMVTLSVGMVALLIGWRRAKRAFDREKKELRGRWLKVVWR